MVDDSRRRRRYSSIPDTPFQRWLERFGACSEARHWVGKQSFVEAWNACDRVGWMGWVLEQLEDNTGFLTDAGYVCRCGFPAQEAGEVCPIIELYDLTPDQFRERFPAEQIEALVFTDL